MWRGPLAYGHAGATRTVLLFTGDDKGNLATSWVGESSKHLGGGATEKLLVQLGQLAPQCEVPLRQDVRDDRERFPDAIGRVKRDSGPGIAGQCREKAAKVAWLAREIAEEGEARATVACGGERRGDRAWSRDGHDCVARGPRS